VKSCVVIPTLNACDLLAEALASLETQTTQFDVVVVDNASTDDTREMLATRFPVVKLVTNDRNLGFGKAVNCGVAAVPTDTDVIVLVNNDVVCESEFVERMVAPFADERVGMVAGVLLQGSTPELIDSAGIELDSTMRSYDALWNAPVAAVSTAPAPVGPCGGAAAYRASVFRDLGGFDPTFFAYWEDVDLALRFQDAGWQCALAPAARALHRHGQTLGAGSPEARALDAFGRGFVLGRYRVGDRRPLTRAAIALVDWPALFVHLVARREIAPLRARARGIRTGRSRPALRAPTELATVTVWEAVTRQWRFVALRLTGRAPRHFAETGGAAARR
jgi:GT2 family glycosyltransferase